MNPELLQQWKQYTLMTDMPWLRGNKIEPVSDKQYSKWHYKNNKQRRKSKQNTGLAGAWRKTGTGTRIQIPS